MPGRRVAATRRPRFYESGQDVTGIDDPLTSYQRFIDRVIHEYENLSAIFKFVTVNAEEAVYRQHQHVRSLVEDANPRYWEGDECPPGLLMTLGFNPQWTPEHLHRDDSLFALNVPLPGHHIKAPKHLPPPHVFSLQ